MAVNICWGIAGGMVRHAPLLNAPQPVEMRTACFLFFLHTCVYSKPVGAQKPYPFNVALSVSISISITVYQVVRSCSSLSD